MESRRKIQAAADVALISLFVGALWLPLLGMAFNAGRMSPEQENRRLAPFPSLSPDFRSLAAFPKDFKKYFEDNFGFRQTLVRGQAFVQLKLFGVSPSPRVMVGKDGWYFLAYEHSPTGARLVPPLTNEELEVWRRLLEGRRDWLAARGIRYLFTIFPGKQTIYPEYLPDNFKPTGPSRLDQLMAYLKEHSSLEVLDLRPALREAKSRHDLYYKTDTHWNFYGGFAAYRALARELGKSFQGLEPAAESETQSAEIKYDGNLVLMMGLGGSIKEDAVDLSLRAPSFSKVGDRPVVISGHPKRVTVTERKEPGPRLVMFHDSGETALIPFLPQHFSRAVFIYQPRLDPALIISERPDIVVQEMSEMFLSADNFADLSELTNLETGGAVEPVQDAGRGPGE